MSRRVEKVEHFLDRGIQQLERYHDTDLVGAGLLERTMVRGFWNFELLVSLTIHDRRGPDAVGGWRK
jgi:hypothetical protein